MIFSSKPEFNRSRFLHSSGESLEGSSRLAYNRGTGGVTISGSESRASVCASAGGVTISGSESGASVCASARGVDLK